MKRDSWVLVILIFLTAILVVLRPSYGWKLRNLIFQPLAPERDEYSLASENEALKAELAILKNIKSQIPEKPESYLRAIVYSRYPMNLKNELLVNAGRNEGVHAGQAVVFGKVLIGKVEKVFDDTALIETIFDNRFETTVRVGGAGVNALLQGGAMPKLSLIPKNADIKKGDIVYSASPSFPYGLTVSEVNEVKISSDQLFKEASLNFSYDINGVQTVLIAKNER